MRKVVLLTLSVFILTCVYSQGKKKNYLKQGKILRIETFKTEKIEQGQTSSSVQLPEYKSVKSGNIDKIKIGKSGNVIGSVRVMDKPLSYYDNAGVLGYVFRADPAEYPSATSSATIMSTYSADYGASWSEPCIMIQSDGGIGDYNNRYPSGVVFSPTGSSDISDTYIFSVGPSHAGGVNDWQWVFAATSKLGCSGVYEDYLDVSTMSENSYGSVYSGSGLMVGTDNVAHFLLVAGLDTKPPPENDSVKFTKLKLYDIIGIWNDTDKGFDLQLGESVNYTEVLSLDKDGTLNTASNYGLSFSKDGQTGYIYLVGADVDYTGGLEPRVFKTSDGGQNWNYIESDFSNWQDELSEMIYPTNQGDYYPRIMEMEGAVDANGNLQLLVKSNSHSSSHLDDNDSLYHTYTNWQGSLLNIEFGDNGISNIIYIDSLNTLNVPNEEGACEYAAGDNGVGWNHMLRVTKSPDEEKVFFTWSDDYSGEFDENCNPDIYGNYRSVNDDTLSSDSSFSYTTGTDFEGTNYFTNAADYAYPGIIVKDGGCWHVPYTQTVTGYEKIFNPSYLDPVTHRYVDGITFGCLVGIENTIATQSFLSVSQNIPNPFSTVSTINVKLDKTADLGIEVLNLLGQVVYTENKGKVNAGNHSFRIDANDYESGLYFYTVKSGTAAVTKKMIIE